MPPVAALLAAPLIPGLLTVGGALAIGATVGLSLLQSSLQRQAQRRQQEAARRQQEQAARAARGLAGELRMGGDVPRSAVFGRARVGGHLVHVQSFGNPADGLDMVYVIGDGVHDGLDAIIIDGVIYPLTLSGTDPWRLTYNIPAATALPDGRQAPLTTGDCIAIFHLGRDGQPASPELVAASNGSWTSAHRLAGMAYVHLRFQYNETKFRSIPSPQFIVRGARCYDPRFDSTAGGVGPQRRNDSSTWVYSENPIVQLMTFEVGVRLAGEVVIGKGVPQGDQVTAAYIAAANICDESVLLPGGGSEPRYRCGYEVVDSDPPDAALDRFLDACAGNTFERAGASHPFAGAARTVVATLTDDDLVPGARQRITTKRPRDQLVNEITARYSAPSQLWQPFAAPSVKGAQARLEDGEQLARTLDFAQVTSSRQAQNLAQIELRRNRLQATASLTVDAKWLVLEPGIDWVRFVSARHQTDRLYEVVRVTRQEESGGFTVALELAETAAGVYSALPGEIIQEQPPASLPPPGAREAALLGFAPFSTAIQNAAGDRMPAHRFVWTPAVDQTVQHAVIEVRPVAEPGNIRVHRFPPRAGEAVVTDNVLPQVPYEARASIESSPPIVSAVTPWVFMGVTPRPTLGGEFLPGSISMEVIDHWFDRFLDPSGEAFRDRFDLGRTEALLADIYAREVQVERHNNVSAGFTRARNIQVSETAAVASEVDTLSAEVFGPNGLPAVRVLVEEEALARVDADEAIAARQTTIEAEVQNARQGSPSLLARIQTLDEARVQGDQALAGSVTTFSARTNYGTANGQIGWVATSGPSGVLAAWRLQLNAGGTSTGLVVAAQAGGGSEIIVDAGRFRNIATFNGQPVWSLGASVPAFILAGLGAKIEMWDAT